jgi:RhoGAP domain
MSRETNVRKSVDEQATPARSVSGKGPMQSSRSHDGHSLRKPPSLSTLALPNFSGMRPPSEDLLNAFASLLTRLPQENRDLLHTVIDLINFVAQRPAIRMPLSNLTVVLCPTLNMSPPILRVLCEAESIWKGLAEGQEDTTDLDSKRDHPNPLPDSQTGLEPEQNFAVEHRVSQGEPNDQSSAVEPVFDIRDPRVARHAVSSLNVSLSDH